MSKTDCGRDCPDDGELVAHKSPLCVLTPKERAALFDELLAELDWIVNHVGISYAHRERLTTLLYRGRGKRGATTY